MKLIGIQNDPFQGHLLAGSPTSANRKTAYVMPGKTGRSGTRARQPTRAYHTYRTHHSIQSDPFKVTP